jgi:hypothetical protein
LEYEMNGVTGFNKPFRDGDSFVKFPERSGSPHAEEAASHAFSLLGVPNTKARHTELRGRPAVVSRFVELTPLSQVRPHHLQEYGHHVTPERVGALGFAEWVASVADRHSNNYALSDKHGLLSIDHGEAFHPDTSHWNLIRTDPTNNKASMLNSPRTWALSPMVTSLPGFTKFIAGWKPEDFGKAPVDHTMVLRALNNVEKLTSLARTGATGFHPIEQGYAAKAMQMRLNHLRRHYLTEKQLTLGTLHDISHAIRGEVESQRGRIQEEVAREHSS